MKLKLGLAVLTVVILAIVWLPSPGSACLGGVTYDCAFYADSYGVWDEEYGILCQGSGGGCHVCWCVCSRTGQPFPC